jgi:hypothetical protein
MKLLEIFVPGRTAVPERPAWERLKAKIDDGGENVSSS